MMVRTVQRSMWRPYSANFIAAFFFRRNAQKPTYLALEMAKQNGRLGIGTPLQRARLAREGLMQKRRLEMVMAILRTKEANDGVRAGNIIIQHSKCCRLPL